eukprot:gene27890-31506_t
MPSGALLPLRNVSTSVYEDLRRCPYRFFALRQLGLRSADELDAEVDKRDFGNWLHAVLGHFHETLQQTPTRDAGERLRFIEDAAVRATREYGLSDAEFLPFAAAWPAVRDGYLDWLAGHEAAGAVFVESEPWKEQPLGALQLVGRLDRIDRMPDGQPFVIDYKTESSAVTKERVKEPTEDTQLAFYAALVADDTLRAAYVNVGEKSSGTQTVEQPVVVQARDALVAGILDDFRRIAEGTPLPVLPVARGDIVSIAVSSAQAGQLMIHGYMQEMVPVAAGQTATLRLAALHAGRYPLHLHGNDQSHREVAILEIRP